VALGVTDEDIDINGTTVIAPPGRPVVVANGGLLALPSNIGRFDRNRFAVVPEVDLNVGYQITPYVRAFVGYTFLYWSNVARPGDQIDRVINPAQLPTTPVTGAQTFGPARPAPLLRDTDFWAQGINFGVEVRF
jgi:hypothetical protein